MCANINTHLFMHKYTLSHRKQTEKAISLVDNNIQYSLSHNVNFATRIQNNSITVIDNIRGKGKAVPLQAWSGLDGSG